MNGILILNTVSCKCCLKIISAMLQQGRNNHLISHLRKLDKAFWPPL